MTKFLYHGTQVSGITELKPSISLEFESFVYATDDIAYALVRAGKQLDQIREEYSGKDQPFEIAECYPEAFKHQFDCEGYIYVFDSKDFELNTETGEYRSRKPVKPIDCWRISNIWEAMMLQRPWRFRFVYDGDKDYWVKVRGGREGFLERKLRNKQKMLEMRNKAI